MSFERIKTASDYIGISPNAYDVRLKTLIDEIIRFRRKNADFSICLELNSDTPDSLYMSQKYGRYDGAIYEKTFNIKLDGEYVFPSKQLDSAHKFLDGLVKGDT